MIDLKKLHHRILMRVHAWHRRIFVTDKKYKTKQNNHVLPRMLKQKNDGLYKAAIFRQGLYVASRCKQKFSRCVIRCYFKEANIFSLLNCFEGIITGHTHHFPTTFQYVSTHYTRL